MEKDRDWKMEGMFKNWEVVLPARSLEGVKESGCPRAREVCRSQVL